MSSVHKLHIIDIENNPYYKNNSQYFLEIKQLIETYPLSYFKMVKCKGTRPEYKNRMYLANWINSCLPKLQNQYYTMNTKCYWIMYGLTDFPLCDGCHKPILRNVRSIFDGYHLNPLAKSIHHNMKCVKLDKVNIDKQRKQTCLMTYGVDSVSKVDYIIEARENTCLKLYGAKCAFGSPQKREQIKNTTKARYGYEYAPCNPQIRNKSLTKYTYNGINFDSAPEIAYYIWLTDNNIQFEYHPNIVFEYIVNNQIHTYQPDFIVENNYVEIKGLQFFKDKDPTKEMICPYRYKKDTDESMKLKNILAEAKHQCMIQNSVIIITEYKKYVDYVNTKYGRNFLHMHKHIKPTTVV